MMRFWEPLIWMTVGVVITTIVNLGLAAYQEHQFKQMCEGKDDTRTQL
jgi:hypothetical protein